jgi:integrase
MVLLATFAQLRYGELVALRRRSLNLDVMEVVVRRATAEMEDGTQIDDDPKSEAGKRTTSLPAALRTDIEFHLTRYAQPGPGGRLFIGPQGGIPRRRNFNRVWKRALRRPASRTRSNCTYTICGTPAARGRKVSGATLKEVMARIGHSSTRAAMIYRHATKERDQAIAAALDTLIDAARSEARTDEPPE